jgi:hypothetical protein
MRTVTLSAVQAAGINRYLEVARQVEGLELPDVAEGQVLEVEAKLVPNGAQDLEVLIHTLAPGVTVTVPDPALLG